MKLLLMLLAMGATAFNASARVGETTGEAEFLAAKITAESLVDWIREMPERPESIGIFQINANYPLRKEFSNVMEVEVIKLLRGSNLTRVLACPECKAPQLTVQDDRVMITKGTPDEKALKALAKRLNVNTFLTMEVYRTDLSVITMATLFHAGSGEILSTESFRVPALNVGGAATQFMLKIGSGFPLGGKDLPPEDESASVSLSLSVMEELGFGKGGLVIGGARGNRSTLVYAVPTLGWRGNFGNSSLQSLKHIGLGFGESEGSQGIVARGGYDLFIGSFVGVGLSGSFLLPLQEDKKRRKERLNGFFGLHIILNIGR